MIAGLQTSVQGAPYRGLRHQAIPASGAADPLSLALANHLVGRPGEALAVEVTLSAARFRADADMDIAVAGAATTVHISARACPAHTCHAVRAGDEIELPMPATGARSYLALSHAIDIPSAFGAGSTCFSGHFGGLGGRALCAGDGIETRAIAAVNAAQKTPANRIPRYENAFLLRTTDGPESGWLERPDALSITSWRASPRMNRMGIALDGGPLSCRTQGNLASSAVFPGTIQCPPGGQPFLLGVDGQTSGGYPRIAQVIRADRHLIGQIRPGASVQFVHVSVSDAQKIYRQKLDFWREYLRDLQLD